MARDKKAVRSSLDPLDLRERCCVAPSPRLRERMVQELHALSEARDMNFGGRIVIDHVGKFLEPVPPDHASFRILLDLVQNGRTWVKLSAPYEVSKRGPPNYDDVGILAKALVEHAPDRMLWGTNWPHPTPGVTKPNDIWMLDMLLDWVPDEATRKKVLVDNPARVYGFA